MLADLGAPHVEDVGTATRAVMRTTTRALKEAPSTPKSTLPTETEAGTGGHKEMAQPPRAPQTRASTEPPVLTTQPASDRRSPLAAETARLLKDHAYVAGGQKRDATLGPMFKESGSGEDEHLTNDNGLLWYAPRANKNTLVIPRTLIPGRLLKIYYILFPCTFWNAHW